MRFKREVLIAKIKDEIKSRQESERKRHKERVDRIDADFTEYMARTKEDWRTFAEGILTVLDQGQPVTRSLVPQGLKTLAYGGIEVRSDESFQMPLFEESRAEELETLLGFLESSSSDEVSLAMLDRAGFKISQIFRW